AARALAAHEVSAAERLRLARRIRRKRCHAIAILLEQSESRAEPHIDVGMRPGELERLLDDLDALALQHVGKARVLFQVGMIEFGNALLLAAIPVMDQG